MVVVHQSAAQGYQLRSATYESARPTYHPGLVDRFVERYGHGTIVEPVAGMRAVLAADRPDAPVVEGTAEDTGLDDRSADTVVAAQAFHWFDHPRAMAEIERILRPGGHLVCAWNVRDDTVPWMRAYTEVVDRHASDTPRRPAVSEKS